MYYQSYTVTRLRFQMRSSFYTRQAFVSQWNQANDGLERDAASRAPTKKYITLTIMYYIMRTFQFLLRTINTIMDFKSIIFPDEPFRCAFCTCCITAFIMVSALVLGIGLAVGLDVAIKYTTSTASSITISVQVASDSTSTVRL